MFKIVILILQGLSVLSNLIGLPGNIISLIFPLILIFWGHLSWNYFFIICGIIGIGEVIEFLSSYISGKYFGMSKKSIYFSIFFAIFLGIIMAPILFGIGAIIGTFLGAFLGTFIYEYFTTNDFTLSFKRGLVSLTGKLTGVTIKILLGFTTVYMTYNLG